MPAEGWQFKAATRCAKMAMSIPRIARARNYGEVHDELTPDVQRFLAQWDKAPLTFDEQEALINTMEWIIRDQEAKASS